MTRDNLSSDSLSEATRGRASFSKHGKTLGAAGHSTEGEVEGHFLAKSGESVVIAAPEGGLAEFRIGLSWDNVSDVKPGFWARLFGRAPVRGVDVDLGCLYELADGTRGAVQAFGDLYGAYDEAPFIALSGDERTGDRAGDDEVLRINGARWDEIRKLIVYIYIYNGVPNWAKLRPRVRVGLPGGESMAVVPGVHDSHLAVCAIAGLENVRGSLKVTNYTEYFPGHVEMDRAFGYGLNWESGEKGGG